MSSTPYIATFSSGDAHSSDIYGIATCQNYTVASSGDGSISMWDNKSASPEPIHLNKTPVAAGFHHLAVGQGGSFAVAVAFDGQVYAWNLQESKELEYPTFKKLPGAWACALPRDDTSTLAAISDLKGRVTLIDLSTGEVSSVFELPNATGSSPCTCVAMSPSALYVAAGYESGKIRVFSTETSRIAYTLPSPATSSRAMKFSPSGNLLAVCGENTIALFTLNGGTFVGTLDGHDAAVYSIDWSPSGEHILSVALDGTAKIWDVETRECTCTLGDADGPLFAGAFLPPRIGIIAGSRAGVVTGGTDKVIRWYREASGSGI